MLYFKKDLIELAFEIIKANGKKDEIKAFNYLHSIDDVIQHYKKAGEYNPIYAEQLNSKIRNDYPIIYEIERLPSNGTPQKDIVNTKNLPSELIVLDTDKYGILISVLLKKGYIKALEDILESQNIDQ